MSGHSKWSTIKRQKGLVDAKRSTAFSKFSRQISLAAREGKDPTMNFKLRLAIDRARAANLPNDNIERAIRVGAGETKGSEVREVVYEGFGPGGVAVLAEAVTDNPNRTSADVRSVFSKYGGSMGSSNSVRWMFDMRGIVRLAMAALTPVEREAMELGVIDVGAADVREESGELVIVTEPTAWARVKEWVTAHGGTITSADLELLPNTSVAPTAESRERLHELLTQLEEHDDVTGVYSNEA